MTRVHAASKDPVASAAVEALLAARWECADLLSRRPSPLTADLLRGHAAELAGSAIAGDQVLSLALETAARDIEAGDDPLAAGVLFLMADAARTASARQSIRDDVLGQTVTSAPVDIVTEVERRLSDQRLPPADLAHRLAAEARLQEALWDDPRLPAGTAVRVAMLRSVEKFIARAAELDPHPPRARKSSRVGLAQRMRPPLAKQVRPPRSTAATSWWSWSAQRTGWLLILGLLVLALVVRPAPERPAPAIASVNEVM